MDSYEKLKNVIEKSNNIVFFGGAGVSTESNIPDFRSTDGLYNEKWEYPPEEILSHSFFYHNPKYFYKFYKEKMIYKDAKPNFAHIFLANLEKEGKLKAIITQNIDRLHQLAGSQNVIELHGNVYENYCISCGEEYDVDKILSSVSIPRCSCGGIIKPKVVLYEEGLNQEDITDALKAISNCDTLIVAGTSLSVYPAANFIEYFQGTNFILINRDKTPYDHYANLVINESVGEVFKKADEMRKQDG